MSGRTFGRWGLSVVVLMLSLLGTPAVGAGENGATAAPEPQWDRTALESAMAYARDQRSSAVVVADHGEVIAERTWSVDADAGSAYRNLLGRKRRVTTRLRSPSGTSSP
ncbi:MAG: hypothetical protein P8Y02_15855 [Deinococcales bacterium]